MGFRTTPLPLFIDLHTSVEPQKEQIFNIILAPSLYWVKHVSIPVKSLHEAKKFLPSLFEDTLPEGKYSYYAYKDNNAFIVFAYNDKKILDILAEKQIGPEQINNVYFAQSEFENMQEAISIDEENVLDIDDHIIVKLPKTFVDVSKPLDLHEHLFSEHSITLSRYGHIATTQSLIRFSLFMGALIAIFALDWMVSKTKISEFEKAPAQLYSEHGLPGTKIQNEVIHETLQKEYSKQLLLRKKTGDILDLKLEKDEYISLYDLQEKVLKIEVKVTSPQRAALIVDTLQKTALSKDQYSDGILRLEFVL